jgi:hypothetical protein
MKFIKNPVFIIILFTIIVFGIGTFLLSKGSSSGSSASTISLKHNSFDFGQVPMDKGHVKHNFDLSVDSKGSVEITKIYTSCMCTEARLIRTNGQTFGPFGMPGHGDSGATSVKLSPGENFQIEADFDPAAHGPQGKGPIERKIIVESNSSSTPKIELTVKADVV